MLEVPVLMDPFVLLKQLSTQNCAGYLVLDQIPLKDSKHLYFSSDQGGFSTSKLRCQKQHSPRDWTSNFQIRKQPEPCGFSRHILFISPWFESQIPFSPVIKICTLSWSDIYFFGHIGGDIYQFQDLENKGKRSLLYWHSKNLKTE